MNRVFVLILCAALGTAFGPWLYDQWQVQAINHDIYWLVTAAGRLMDGQGLLKGAYEVNPPLSILIYLPVAVMVKAGIAVEHGILLYILSLVIAASVACSFILRAWPAEIDCWTRIYATLSLIVVSTLMVNPHFGQRDHIIFLGLVPFMLTQMATTQSKHIPAFLKYAVLICGAFVMMLKPHYGVIPALILADRFVRRGFSFGILKDPDVIVLICLPILYAGFCYIAFPDYFHIILPDALRFYVLFGRDPPVEIIGILACLGSIALVSSRFIPIRAEHKKFVTWFIIASLGSLFVFAVMRRYYMYQLLPALSFFALAGAWSLYFILRKGMGPRAAFLESLTIFIVFCHFMPHSYAASRQNIEVMPLVKLVHNDCPQRGSFMIWTYSLRVTQLTSRYSDCMSGSRFAHLWFMPGIIDLKKNAKKSSETQDALALQRRYGDYIAGDLDHFRPAIVISCNEMTDDIDFFSASPDFKKEWKSYRHAGSVIVDEQAYFLETGSSDPPRCEVYRRQSPM